MAIAVALSGTGTADAKRIRVPDSEQLDVLSKAARQADGAVNPQPDNASNGVPTTVSTSSQPQQSSASSPMQCIAGCSYQPGQPADKRRAP